MTSAKDTKKDIKGKEERGDRFRQLKGASKIYFDTLLTLIPIIGIAGILNLPSYFGFSFYLQQYTGILFGLMVASSLVAVPANKRLSLTLLPWYDLALSLIAVACGLYIAMNYKLIAVDIGVIKIERVILGIGAVFVTVEASRRVLGTPFVTIVLVFICYALFSSHLPWGLSAPSIDYQNLATYLYLDPQGILGVPLQVACGIVLVFILFGQTISVVGVSKLFNDVSFALMGGYRGGPAKVSIVGSSLFGMISGSAVANVATVGVFTIPLMKKSGYQPHFAGAISAVSGTGGQIMPPIMGAAAFIMATFLGIPYSHVVIAAIVPAVLYYIAVFIQVDLRAAKENLSGIPRSELPRFRNVMREYWLYSIPFGVLIYTLFVAWMQEEVAGLYATLSAVVLGFIVFKKTGMTFSKLILIFRDCGKGMLEVGIASAGAGIIIGALTLTGLAFSFSGILIDAASGNVFLLLVLSAIVSSILGMGMTVTAAYLLTVVIAAPALTEMGIQPLLAHFFVFYFAVLSFLTPPVCLAAYAAASIAGASMMKTAFQSMKLGIAAYIVPFIFAYKPALLLQGGFWDILEACLTATAGISLVAVGVEAFLFRPLSVWRRLILIGGGVMLMIPGLTFDIIGLCAAAPVVALEIILRKKEKKTLIEEGLELKGV